ncbi:copper amine oxidase [Scenedesmus sp. NREL 46B-D3]|nr:copper amine oxidase [Scenedesmus sp. NREL 46B-D3]
MSEGPHPLDPLTEVEVKVAAESCLQHAASLGLPPLRFNTITLQVQQCGAPLVVIEALVDLRSHAAAAAVVSWVKLDGSQMDGQPLATPDDCLEAEAIARQDPQVQALVAARGIPLDQVACDPWAIHACPREWLGRRLMQARATGSAQAADSAALVAGASAAHAAVLVQVFMYYKSCPDDNEYAHPMDLCPVVDLHAGKVIHIDAYPQPPAIPMRGANYHRALLEKPFREAPAPLLISQPRGPSFKVDGWHISWQKWDFRIGFNGREGLVLYDLGYADGDQQGRRRPILHRASIGEMCVPYADPRSPYNRKAALDAGDYGLGFAANSLELGCDCLGDVAYFDAVVNDAAGQPVVIKNAVCLHEEDHGLLWKHLDYRTGYASYEYCFYWLLYQDGSIGMDIKLTGILSTSLLSPGESSPSHGTLVGPGVNAAHHQHLFSARLDMAVDDDDGGRNLVVSEVNAVQQPTGASNPEGNAFNCTETDLTRVHAAQRNAAHELNRVWRVKNPARLHPHSGQPVAYHIHPAPGPCLLAQPGSAVARRALFTTRNLWVTPHEDGQLYPAGKYVFQSWQDSGLALWTQQDVSLLGADPVIWLTFGVTHFVRPEDAPVMPCDQVGFLLKPFGFFESNPALDVPPEDTNHNSRSSSSSIGAGASGAGSSSCCASAPGAAGAGSQGVLVVTSNIRANCYHTSHNRATASPSAATALTAPDNAAAGSNAGSTGGSTTNNATAVFPSLMDAVEAANTTAAGNMSILMSALEASGVGSAIPNDTAWTILAPNNAAFEKTLAALNLTAQELLANQSLLTTILSYHVIPAGALNSSSLTTGASVATALPGANLTVDIMNMTGTPNVHLLATATAPASWSLT